MGWVVNATPMPLYPRQRPGTHCVGGWVGLRAGLDSAENLAPTGIRSPDRPARCESLYRLSYSDPFAVLHSFFIFFQILILPAVICVLSFCRFFSFALVLSKRIRNAHRTVVIVAITGPDSNQNLRNTTRCSNSMSWIAVLSDLTPAGLPALRDACSAN
jgi:hypothetical protein